MRLRFGKADSAWDKGRIIGQKRKGSTYPSGLSRSFGKADRAWSKDRVIGAKRKPSPTKSWSKVDRIWDKGYAWKKK